jgi:hypothetical protein
MWPISAFVWLACNRIMLRAYFPGHIFRSCTTMMNDWRDPVPSTVEENRSLKIAAAAIVLFGFGAIGTYAYESSAGHAQPIQAVASNPAVQQAAAQTPATPDVVPNATQPEAPPAAEPVKDASVDNAAPVAPAQTAQAAKPVKVARVQKQAPAPETAAPANPPAPKPAESTPPAAAAPEPAKEAVAAPMPAEPAAQDSAPAAAASSDTSAAPQ